MGPAMAIDTLGYAKVLKQAGIPAEQAEAHAEALRDKVIPDLATKQDLKELESRLLGEFGSVRVDMWRLAFAVVLGTTTLVTALQKLMP